MRNPTTIYQEQKCFGTGICLRDDNGCFLKAKTSWLCDTTDPKEAEAWSRWQAYLGCRSSTFRMSFLKLIDAIAVLTSGISDFDIITNKCRQFLSPFNNEFCKDTNVHELTIASRFCAHNQVFDSIPTSIFSSIMNDVINVFISKKKKIANTHLVPTTYTYLSLSDIFTLSHTNQSHTSTLIILTGIGHSPHRHTHSHVFST